ncbi:MAG: OsmC family protein [Acidobacteriaceae bacterium]|jgi:organic hydroperoxide reductase OsmC/OhrA
MARLHSYSVTVTWTGNTGTGTSGYREYQRSHEISAAGKSAIAGSSDPAFRGDPTRWNPEELLVASLSTCHQLWYLHLCADAGIVIEAYVDEATGVMEESGDGGGQFVEVTLRPNVRLAPGSDHAKAHALHHHAHAKCFIARSVNFPVKCEPIPY